MVLSFVSQACMCLCYVVCLVARFQPMRLHSFCKKCNGSIFSLQVNCLTSMRCFLFVMVCGCCSMSVYSSVLCIWRQDVCRTDIFIDIRGVIVKYEKSCSESSTCRSFSGLQCSLPTDPADPEDCHKCSSVADSCFCPGKLATYDKICEWLRLQWPSSSNAVQVKVTVVK